MTTRRTALLAGAAVPLTALFARGQTPGTGTGPAQSAGEDPLLAACLLVGGRKQIENCTFAKAKLTNDDARKFAQAEIDEHEHIKAELKKLGYEYPVLPAVGRPTDTRPTEPAKPEERKDGDPPKPVAVNVGGGRPLPMEAAALVVVDHEVADQCILNYRKEMDKLSGLKLDKRFVGHQLDEHLALKDKAETFRRHASKDMKPVLDDGLKIIGSHIATLKGLMTKLDGMQEKGDK